MTAHVTIALDDAQKAELDTIAEARSESLETVLSEAVRNLIDYERYYRAAVQEGLQDLREGRTISHDDLVTEVAARRATWPNAAKA